MSYDVAVIGLGGVGSAALYQLARRGAKVVGFEQFPLVHDRGSSHGHSRVIRKAYFEHPDYVPLLEVAYAEWADLAATVGRQLYLPTGVLQVGPADGEVLQGVLQSAATHGLAVQTFDGADVAQRYPGLAAPAEHGAVLEADAGILRVEDCVRAHVDAAREAGALVQAPAAVAELRPVAGGFEIRAGGQPVIAKQVVLTTGAWRDGLLDGLDLGLELLGKSMFWHGADPGLRLADGLPAFLFESEAGVFYGMPAFDGFGVKLAQHSEGEPLDGPDAYGRPVPDAEREAVAAFRARSLPGLVSPEASAVRCMYTCTRDGHFLVDRHPEQPGLQFALGLSGHGFKLAPTLGRALADRALDGETSLPVAFLARAGRAAGT